MQLKEPQVLFSIDSTTPRCFSNTALISHAFGEFTLDFALVEIGEQPGVIRVKSRVVLTPSHAKQLLATLGQNIERYEATFGPVRMPPDKPGADVDNIISITGAKK